MKTIRIGIIGGGATGAMTARHLLELNRDYPQFQFAIDIFEPNAQLGGGRAYGANDERLLLNVPAAKMSCSTAKPSEFLDFLNRNYPGVVKSPHFPFVPRVYFREYLQQCLKNASAHSPGALVHRRTEVQRLEMKSRTWLVQSETANHEYDYIFLAQGYREDFQAQAILKTNTPDSERILPCHQIGRIQRLPESDRILIAGTGLSAIDTWRLLRDTHKRPLLMLSRRGLLPLSHSQRGRSNSKFPDWTSLSPRQITSLARFYYRSGLAEWPDIADSIRSHATRIWGTWTRFEKRQFLRHIRPYWEIIRHRLPASIHKELSQDIALGKLRILRGRILNTSIEGLQAKVTWFDADKNRRESFCVDRIVLATGSRIEDTLGSTTWTQIGIDRSEYGLGLMNRAAPYLWILGPQAKSLYWEITAAPEIRHQIEGSMKELVWHIQRPREPLWLAQLKVHPHNTEERFLLHFNKALEFSMTLARLSLLTLVHALFPYKYLDNTSDTLRDLAKLLSKRREKRLDPSRLRSPKSRAV